MYTWRIYNKGNTRYRFCDLGYPAKYGKVFVLLRDYVMLEYQSTILYPNYKERATKIRRI